MGGKNRVGRRGLKVNSSEEEASNGGEKYAGCRGRCIKTLRLGYAKLARSGPFSPLFNREKKHRLRAKPV